MSGSWKSNASWGPLSVPDGWIWQDIGNYYGAGASLLNWRENQYDLVLKSGHTVGDPVTIVGTVPVNLFGLTFLNKLTSGETGSGDNAYIYLAPGSSKGYILGTIPINEDHFKVSGSYPDPARSLINELNEKLAVRSDSLLKEKTTPFIFYAHLSPPLDSINYWFLKKSINLYGEALVKTLGYKMTNSGTTDSGVSVIRNFWKRNGIEPSALKILDGSGLSPGNRVTTRSLVSILKYAAGKNWFPSFFYALPEINGIKMKDGYIGGVRSYTGYIKDRQGIKYLFSFIVNNFDGSPATVREKMWKVLDILK